MAKIEIEIEPWTTPNFVRAKAKIRKRQDGFKINEDCIPLSDCSYETLNQMCNDFRKEVFSKAGVEDKP